MYLRIEQGLGPPRYIPLSGALAPSNLLYGTGTIIYVRILKYLTTFI